MTATRTADVFVPLDDRAQMASEATADLLISIHADALDAKRLGVEECAGSTRRHDLHPVGNASDEQAKLLAQNENKADLKAGVGSEQAAVRHRQGGNQQHLQRPRKPGQKEQVARPGQLLDRAHERQDEIQYPAAAQRQFAGVEGGGRSGGAHRTWISKQHRGREIADLAGMARQTAAALAAAVNDFMADRQAHIPL